MSNEIGTSPKIPSFSTQHIRVFLLLTISLTSSGGIVSETREAPKTAHTANAPGEIFVLSLGLNKCLAARRALYLILVCAPKKFPFSLPKCTTPSRRSHINLTRSRLAGLLDNIPQRVSWLPDIGKVHAFISRHCRGKERGTVPLVSTVSLVHNPSLPPAVAHSLGTYLFYILGLSYISEL